MKIKIFIFHMQIILLNAVISYIDRFIFSLNAESKIIKRREKEERENRKR